MSVMMVALEGGCGIGVAKRMNFSCVLFISRVLILTIWHKNTRYC